MNEANGTKSEDVETSTDIVASPAAVSPYY